VSYLRREELIGKIVIDENANTYGKVKDVVFSVSGEVAFVVEKKDGSDEIIPLSEISKIGEYILLKPRAPTPPVRVQPPTPTPQPSPQAPQPYPPEAVQPQAPIAQPVTPAPQPAQAGGILCPSCGFVNPPDSKFCIRCGTPLPQQKKGFLSRFL